MIPRLLSVSFLGGCTLNFWQLRTGVLGGEVEGSVETTLSSAEGCGDLVLFSLNEGGTGLLTLSLDGVLEAQRAARRRLETILLAEQAAGALTFQTGQNLYGLPCYGEYDGYDVDEDEGRGEGGVEVWRAFTYTDGDARLHLTARRRAWDEGEDPVHAKLTLQDVVLTEQATGATVEIPGMLVQAYIYPWYWY